MRDVIFQASFIFKKYFLEYIIFDSQNMMKIPLESSLANIDYIEAYFSELI